MSTPTEASGSNPLPPRVAVWETGLAFLKLGLTSFGGPVAHLALFRLEFVVRRGWLDESRFAGLLTLCQSLPGPSSSQMGMLLGHSRGGLPHAIAAWAGFTLPGALAMACAAALMTRSPLDSGWVAGLESFSVAVIAQAVWSMARSLTPDARRLAMALAATLVCRWLPGGIGQLAAIFLGAALGRFLAPPSPPENGQEGAGAAPLPRRLGGALLATCLALFALLPLLGNLLQTRPWALLDGMFRSGALVFGGGHVVLPLLQTEVAARLGIPDATFLAGYGIAQGMPGPLFNISSFLGFCAWGIPGALLGVVAIFLPGALIALGALPFWTNLQRHDGFRRAQPGLNAAVVGLLFAAFLDPVCPRGLGNVGEVLVATASFALLQWRRLPAWLLAIASACAGWLFLGG
ncbi:MAG: chromate efflux transporter [Fibrobacteria bacterium]|nr:chromate efflux transporter [Fibrobacteria bacterium]